MTGGETLGRQAIKYAPPLLFPCLASLASLRYNFTILPCDRRQVETWVVNSQSTNACPFSEAPNRQVILNSTCYSDLQIGVSLSAHCAKECRGLSRPIQKHATAWPRIDKEQSQASPGTQATRKTPERPRPRDPRSSGKGRGERKRRRAAIHMHGPYTSVPRCFAPWPIGKIARKRNRPRPLARCGFRREEGNPSSVH